MADHWVSYIGIATSPADVHFETLAPLLRARKCVGCFGTTLLAGLHLHCEHAAGERHLRVRRNSDLLFHTELVEHHQRELVPRSGRQLRTGMGHGDINARSTAT